MLKRSDWSTMACRHGQPTRLARYRTSKCARHTGAGLWFERCPGGGAVLLRWRGVLGLLCAARGRLGVGPVLLLRLHGRANGVVAPDTVTSCAPAVGSSAPLSMAGTSLFRFCTKTFAEEAVPCGLMPMRRRRQRRPSRGRAASCARGGGKQARSRMAVNLDASALCRQVAAAASGTRQWSRRLSRLASRYRVYVPDLPGQYGSQI
jgi:hypothetical protein